MFIWNDKERGHVANEANTVSFTCIDSGLMLMYQIMALWKEIHGMRKFPIGFGFVFYLVNINKNYNVHSLHKKQFIHLNIIQFPDLDQILSAMICR